VPRIGQDRQPTPPSASAADAAGAVQPSEQLDWVHGHCALWGLLAALIAALAAVLLHSREVIIQRDQGIQTPASVYFQDEQPQFLHSLDGTVHELRWRCHPFEPALFGP